MKGCRALSDKEVAIILYSMQGMNAARTAALFILGVRTGLRISELLSIKINDLIFKGKIVEKLRVERRFLKGGKAGNAKRPTASSRTIPLSKETHPFIKGQLAVLKNNGWLRADAFFFQSRLYGDSAISRRQAWEDLTAIYDVCNLEGKIATHGMRKTFARIAMDHYRNQWHPGKEPPIRSTQKALGHASIVSTESYVEFMDTEYLSAFEIPILPDLGGKI